MAARRWLPRCASKRAKRLSSSAARCTKNATSSITCRTNTKPTYAGKCRTPMPWPITPMPSAPWTALHRELMDLNPSAARSLEEGMEETLTVHRLRVPNKLRSSLSSTNIIESAFSLVETVCRNVKRWQGGDQYLRWVASGLLWSESRWNRLHGYREMPILVKELELAIVKSIPVRHASVA